MTDSHLDLIQIDTFIRTDGHATFSLGGRAITFDLSNRHERAYAATLLMNVRYPQSDIDSYLFRRFLRAGDSVLDAGANVGFTALECLAAGARLVVAVEPVPELFARLQTVAGGAVIAIRKAISAEEGAAEIMVSKTHNQGSSLSPRMLEMFPAVFGENPQKLDVEVTTIDCLVEQFGAFDVWKLDIEGAEIDALLGASRTLAVTPPRLIMAELYGDFFGQFYDLILKTHPFAYRVFIRRDDYGLEIVDYNAPATDSYHPTSPTFVFAMEPYD